MTKILVVDDSGMILLFTKKILSPSYEVITTSSPKKAIELYDSEKPDLILSDFLMPEMDGFAMHELLQSKHKEKIPIMYMTADDDESIEGRGFDLGAADFIRKPFKPEVLLKRIENILSNIEKIKDLTEEATIDKLTGCLNKSATIKEMTAKCESETGILMIIDLDSFKLVNDIYGHDMGDKILIAFSEEIGKLTEGRGIVGRIGGDEFVAFLENTDNETPVAEFALRLNEGLMAKAKMYMGEDMNIPLGASIGAVMVPSQGNEYDSLFRMADKALYLVKQNGKHGYSFYKETGKVDLLDNKNSTLELKRLSTILEERNTLNCAFWLGQEAFSNVYRFMVRFIQSYNVVAQKLLFTVLPLNKNMSEKDFSDICSEFGGIVNHSLRKSDIMMQSNTNCFFLLLPELSEQHVKIVIERIMNQWRNSDSHDKVEITYETEFLTAENINDERRNGIQFL